MISRLEHRPPPNPNGTRKRAGRTTHHRWPDMIGCLRTEGHGLQRRAAGRARQTARQERCRGDRNEENGFGHCLRRPPAAGNAETLRMIAPGPDDRTAKQGWSSDRSGGAGEAKSVLGRSEPSETATLRWPPGHATEQNRETWRRFFGSSTDVASRRNQMARADLREGKAD